MVQYTPGWIWVPKKDKISDTLNNVIGIYHLDLFKFIFSDFEIFI